MRILHRKELPRNRLIAGGVAGPVSVGPMQSSIGIVGSGGLGACTSACFLRAHDVPVTIYADKDPDAIRAGQAAQHRRPIHHHTLERERRALGVDHWDVAEHGYVCHHHCHRGRAALPAATSSTLRRPSTTASTCRALIGGLPGARGGELAIVPTVGLEEIERLSQGATT